MSIPILDNHVHLEPIKGRNVDSAREFEKLGGTHLIISHLPYDHVEISKADDFRTAFDVTVNIKDRVNKETSLHAYATVGPYPVELLSFQRRYGLETAKQIMMEGMDIAAEYVANGRAIAIGEVGRPHFPVGEEVWSASNDILRHGMQVARRTGCAIVLHTEGATPESMKELAHMAESVGLEPGRVVKHYSPPLVHEDENFGLVPSVLAGKSAVQVALSKGDRFMLETDFLDDPSRPGAVLAIGTVPRRTKTLMEKGVMSEEAAHKIHHDVPRAVYGKAFV
ncbi:MAG: TatD family hydrolase [Thermoplasmata archaeon]|nr:TatD family hydrolase [Thermoplasmata archaeon]